jgi:hypothetical protein
MAYVEDDSDQARLGEKYYVIVQAPSSLGRNKAHPENSPQRISNEQDE